MISIGFTGSFGFAADSNQPPPTPPKQSDDCNMIKPMTEAEKEELKKAEDNLKNLTLVERMNVFHPPPGGWLRKQWDKLKLSLDGKLLDKNWPMGENMNLGIGLSWQFMVKPAFIKDYQQRFDIYSVNPSLGWSLRNVGFSLALGGQVTFSRLYKSKWEAIKGQSDCNPHNNKSLLDHLGIYFLNRIPFEPEDLWAPNRPETGYALNPGDAVRIEYFTSGSAGTGKEDVTDLFKTSGSLGASRSSAFIVDIYKLKGSHVRVRMVATRNTLTASVGTGVEFLKNLATGNYFILLRKFFEKWTNIKPLSAGFSMVPSQHFPVATFMVDYVFDLSKPEAAKAYGDFMSLIKNPETFIKDLHFLKSQSALAKTLLEDYIKPIDKVYQESRRRPLGERAIDRIFKGRANSTNFSFSGGSELTAFLTGNLTNSVTHTNITSYNSDETNRHFTYVSSSSNIKHTRLKVDGFEINDGISGLFEANRLSDVEYEPRLLQDFILTSDYQNSYIGHTYLNQVKKNFEYSIPYIASQIEWGKLLAIKDATNGYVRNQFIIHDRAFHYLALNDYPQLRSRLSDFMWNHPNVQNFKNYAMASGTIADSDYHALEAWITNMARQMDITLNGLELDFRTIDFQALRVLLPEMIRTLDELDPQDGFHPYKLDIYKDLKAFVLKADSTLKNLNEENRKLTIRQLKLIFRRVNLILLELDHEHLLGEIEKFTPLALKANSILHDQDTDDRFTAFKALKGDKLFQEISMGFITSLLPQDKLFELVYFNLVAGSRETEQITMRFGTNGESDFYKSMQYILSLINDRSFDLRLQMNEKGEVAVYHSNEACPANARCDDLRARKN